MYVAAGNECRDLGGDARLNKKQVCTTERLTQGMGEACNAHQGGSALVGTEYADAGYFLGQGAVSHNNDLMFRRKPASEVLNIRGRVCNVRRVEWCCYNYLHAVLSVAVACTV